jgi:hypothetical protein
MSAPHDIFDGQEHDHDGCDACHTRLEAWAQQIHDIAKELAPAYWKLALPYQNEAKAVTDLMNKLYVCLNTAPESLITKP